MRSESQSCFGLSRSLLLLDSSPSVSGVLRCWHVCQWFSTRYFGYRYCPCYGSFALKSADCYKNDWYYFGCACYYRYASVSYSAESCYDYNSGYD